MSTIWIAIIIGLVVLVGGEIFASKVTEYFKNEI